MPRVFTFAHLDEYIDADCSEEAYEAIESYLVETMVCILEIAHLIVVNSKRVTIFPKDLDIAVRAINNNCLTSSCLNVNGRSTFSVPNNVIRRLTYKAHIKLVRAGTYEKIKSLIGSILDHLNSHLPEVRELQAKHVEKAIRECRQ